MRALGKRLLWLPMVLLLVGCGGAVSAERAPIVLTPPNTARASAARTAPGSVTARIRQVTGTGSVSSGTAPPCQPASPVSPSALGPPEVRGAATTGEFWALLHAGMPHAGQDSSIIWRMTGAGPLQVVALGPAGQQLGPTLLYETGGSPWQRPGDEWVSNFVFPSSGCWQMRATRGNAIGSMWLAVLP